MQDFIKEIAREAGNIVLQKFGKIGVKYTKRDDTDVVTEADVASNELLVGRIKDRFPSHGIISEEQPEFQQDADYVWIVDPLDGTRNYSTHTPLFAVLVGLAHQGKMQLATIFDPLHDEMFFAERGKGAALNGQPIVCSKRAELKHSFGCLNTHWSVNRIDWLKKVIHASETSDFWTSGFGSVAVSTAFVAAGRRDWYCGFGSFLWDYAATSLVLSESGCTVTNAAGEPWQIGHRELVAANPALHPTILKMLGDTTL